MIDVDAALAEQQLQSRMLLQVHDELIFEVAPGEREQLEALVLERMGRRRSSTSRWTSMWGSAAAGMRRRTEAVRRGLSALPG